MPIHVARELARLDEPWARSRPELIADKHARMKDGPVPFFRATAPLFFLRLREELSAAGLPPLAPLALWLAGEATPTERTSWCAGDVHVENFGSYRSPDNVERFGLNDFDDAVIAPVDVDAIRLACSVIVAARNGGVDGSPSVDLARRLLDRYAKRIAAGDAGEDPTANEVPAGAPAELLAVASEATREKFLDRRAPVQKDGRRAFANDARWRPVTDPEERSRVLASFAKAVAPFTERRPGYYQPIDVARRTAGLGSLGVGRYAVLVEGKSGGKDPKENVLLEMKEARTASVARHGGAPAPRAFEDDAERVVLGQIALRGEAQPHLGRTTLDERPYYLRRLSHREQRVDLTELGASAKVLEPLVEAEALALARAHVRARRAVAPGPLAFPQGLLDEWLALAIRLSGIVEADYLAFCSG